ncbi:TetR family transcriptional regulator [Marinobacter lutaoensis]|nr:TetR family transcriptional regulator [Marinobacter lutaoensis]
MSTDSRRQQGVHTRVTLLEAATREFARSGYHGASTCAIARAQTSTRP